MKVYTLVWETYGYMDNETSVEVELFKDMASAMEYYESLKMHIIEEYLEHAGCESLNDLSEDYFYIDDTPVRDGSPYLFIDYDDYGHDRIRIYEKSIMSFMEG